MEVEKVQDNNISKENVNQKNEKEKINQEEESHIFKDACAPHIFFDSINATPSPDLIKKVQFQAPDSKIEDKAKFCAPHVYAELNTEPSMIFFFILFLSCFFFFFKKSVNFFK